MNSTRQTLFSERLSFAQKIGKIWAYLFQEFPFRTGQLDYEDYWNQVSQGYRPVSLAKQQMIASLIEEGSSVLDIGCGDGNLLEYLKKERKAIPYGIDVSAKAVSLTNKRGIDASVADLTKDDFQLPGTYDYAIISEVLEHLPNP
ncbi:MAG: methionine biosynthesis protein MetW, partial [Dehalococcoidales bacterium]|nr:methionine biosynthesis protein MetW [Dehalococcoidales bacterium]